MILKRNLIILIKLQKRLLPLSNNRKIFNDQHILSISLFVDFLKALPHKLDDYCVKNYVLVYIGAIYVRKF